MSPAESTPCAAARRSSLPSRSAEPAPRARPPCAVRQALCAVRQAPVRCAGPLRCTGPPVVYRPLRCAGPLWCTGPPVRCAGPLCGASGPLCGVFGGVRKLGGAVCRVKAQRDLHEGYPCAKQGWYRELCFAPFWRGRGFFVCLCAHGAPAIPFCACAVPPSPAQGPRARMSARQTANKTPSRPHDAAERTIPAHTTHSHTATGTHNTSTHTLFVLR